MAKGIGLRSTESIICLPALRGRFAAKAVGSGSSVNHWFGSDPPMAALIKAFDPVLGWMARRYQAAVAKELKNYGLRYEDLYDPAMNLVLALTSMHTVPAPRPHHPWDPTPNPRLWPLHRHRPCVICNVYIVHCRT